MADSGIQTAVGDNEYLLGSFVTAVGIIFWTDFPNIQVDFLSETFPPRIMHGGWIGLASGDNATAGSGLTYDVLQMTWWSYFDHASNGRQFNPGWVNIDRVVFSIPTGVIAKFQVFW